jgi:ribonuclease D
MFEETPLVMVRDRATLDDVVKKLTRATAIGVDTESDSFYTYQEKVCLVQISDDITDYIIDPLALGRDLSPLARIFEDRSITKIFHGADYDVVCMKRDFGFEIHGLFDTLIAAQLIGMSRFGLADLIERYFGIQLDKAYQRHDWAARPLLPEHLEYARGDTHWLRALREIMTRQVVRGGRLRHLEEECRILEKRSWQGKGFDPEGWQRVKGSIALDDTGKRVLRKAWAYRDSQAKQMDRPSFKVMPDDVLLALARVRPRDERELDEVVSERSALRRRHGRMLLQVVAEGLADKAPFPKPKKEKPKGPRPRLTGRLAERALAELKLWRNRRGPDAQIAAFTIASNGTLKAIAQRRPVDLDELGKIPEVRVWQVEEYGPEILAVLERADPRRKRPAEEE